MNFNEFIHGFMMASLLRLPKFCNHTCTLSLYQCLIRVTADLLS